MDLNKPFNTSINTADTVKTVESTFQSQSFVTIYYSLYHGRGN